MVEPPPTPNDVVICVALGKPTVTVPELSPTSTSFDVPCIVSVPPKAIADVLLPSDIVTEEFASFALAIEPANIALVISPLPTTRSIVPSPS